MGHIVFLLLHGAALLFAPLLLVITIPLHLIYAAVQSKETGPRPNPWTHVKCPDCKGLVPKEARRCMHCGCPLVPEGEQRQG